jgi:hypothetical protein
MTSPYFCPHCEQSMVADETPGGELVFECSNARCRKVVHASVVLVATLTAAEVAQRRAWRAKVARGGAILDEAAYSDLVAV